MAMPRKYSTPADRWKAYRARKKERVEALAREVKVLKAKAGGFRRGAKFLAKDHDVLRAGLAELRREITRRRQRAKAQRVVANPDMVRIPELVALVNYIESELDRLLK
jgi:hypothetical protein